MVPPRLSLREDFTRNLPHMMPWMIEGRPVPCVYDGDLAELLYQQGLAGILNQTAVWLDRAVDGTLIDPEQGWEPVRRDAFSDLVVVAAEAAAGAGRQARRIPIFGGELPESRWGRRHGVRSLRAFGRKRSGSRGRTYPRRLARERVVEACWRRGSSLCLVVWPGKEASGRPIICDSYFPRDGWRCRRVAGQGRALRLPGRTRRRHRTAKTPPLGQERRTVSDGRGPLGAAALPGDR